MDRRALTLVAIVAGALLAPPALCMAVGILAAMGAIFALAILWPLSPLSPLLADTVRLLANHLVLWLQHPQGHGATLYGTVSAHAFTFGAVCGAVVTIGAPVVLAASWLLWGNVWLAPPILFPVHPDAQGGPYGPGSDETRLC